jgi:predicted acylesterase/phospholipase RssA
MNGRREKRRDEKKKIKDNGKNDNLQNALVLQGGGALAAYEAGEYMPRFFLILEC